MKTSELIAEILVIGVGATLWIILLLISLFDGLASTATELSYLSLVPVMAIVYVFGKMTDRIGDIFFGRFLPSKYSNWSASKTASWKNARDRMIAPTSFDRASAGRKLIRDQ